MTASPKPATSLGGVESLVEQRVLSEPGVDPRLICVSVGVEDLEVWPFVLRCKSLFIVEAPQDLKGDLRRAFREIIKPFCAKL